MLVQSRCVFLPPLKRCFGTDDAARLNFPYLQVPPTSQTCLAFASLCPSPRWHFAKGKPHPCSLQEEKSLQPSPFGFWWHCLLEGLRLEVEYEKSVQV